MSADEPLFPIETLQITNFRGLREQQVSLHPKITVFFGANAAGKTTVLDALTIALGALVKRVPKSEGRDFAKQGDLRLPWVDRPALGERAGVEAPFARITAQAANGISWDVTRYRSEQDREGAPAGHGVRQLHGWLDPQVVAALDTPPGDAAPRSRSWPRMATSARSSRCP